MKTKTLPRHAGLYGTLLLFLFNTLTAAAQNPAADGVDMADGLRQSGKIYVVVAVVVVIVVGLLLYLLTLDRKVSKLEKELKS